LIQEALQVNPELTAEALSRHGTFGLIPAADEFIRNLQAAGLP
jgi:hypothetical protein